MWVGLTFRATNVRAGALELHSVDISKLENSPIGQLVAINGPAHRMGDEHEYSAFLPNPLPDEVDLSNETWNGLIRASSELAVLKELCNFLPNPRLLTVPALLKEAQATSALEGTYGELSDVLEARLPGFTEKSPEIIEIGGYSEMAEHAFEWVKDRPITMGLLCDLQKILAEDSRNPPPDAGRVRRVQVIIGSKGGSFQEARFIPPPPELLQSELDTWVKWLNTEHELHPLLKAVMCHYQFETLHPFSDCNGRVGRLLILLHLMQGDLLDHPALTISSWLLHRRDEYQDQLLAVSQTGDWNPWIQFLCQGIEEQCRSHIMVANQLVLWQADVRAKLNDKHWSGTIVQLAESLIEWPAVTARSVQDKYEVSSQTANYALDRLVKIGAIEEVTGRSYHRVFGATAVINLVESL